MPDREPRLNASQRAALRVSAWLAITGVAILAWLDPASNRAISILSACAAAAIVAAILRALGALTPEATRDYYRSSHHALREAIDHARQRLDVLITWIPDERDRGRIARSTARRIRVLLSSSRPGGHLQSRIAGRKDCLSLQDAQQRIAATANLFMATPDAIELRFNHGHLPGWVVVADDRVFWGPFPVDCDCFAEEWWCHADTAAGDWGQFWIQQFERIWTGASNDWHVEAPHNPALGAPAEP